MAATHSAGSLGQGVEWNRAVQLSHAPSPRVATDTVVLTVIPVPLFPVDVNLGTRLCTFLTKHHQNHKREESVKDGTIAYHK